MDWGFSWKRAALLFLSCVEAGVRTGAGLLAFVSLVPFLSPWWSAMDQYSHFRVQYLLAGLVLLALAMGRRMTGAALWLMVVLSVNLVIVLSLYRQTVPTVGSTGNSFRVMTFNGLFSNPQPWDSIRHVSRYRADFAFYQEVSGGLWQAIQQQMLPHQYYYNRGATAYSHKSFTAYHPWSGVRAESTDSIVPSDFLRADIPADPAGRWPDFILIGIHPASPGNPAAIPVRDAQLLALARYIRTLDKPVIVLGDFNISPWSRGWWRFMAESGLKNTQTRPHLTLSWPAHAPWWARTVIDHVLVSDDFAVTHHASEKVPGSDHLPVVVDLVWAKQQ